MANLNFKNYFSERTKNKTFTTIISLYILFCLASTVFWCINFQLRNLLMSFLFIALVPLIFIVEYLLKIRCGHLFTAGVLSLALGSILGTCFNLYTYIPFFDTILHGMSGVLFGCLGYTFAEKFFGRAENKRKAWGCLLFSVCFSLAIAVVWEIFEYACTCFLGFDMMEDTLVTDISSYLLAGSHTEIVSINGIVKTVIYYGNGQTYTLNGYLDLGLIDTLTDLIICTCGAAVFFIISAISFYKFPKINKMLIPQSFDNESVTNDDTPETQNETQN